MYSPIAISNSNIKRLYLIVSIAMESQSEHFIFESNYTENILNRYCTINTKELIMFAILYNDIYNSN